MKVMPDFVVKCEYFSIVSSRVFSINNQKYFYICFNLLYLLYLLLISNAIYFSGSQTNLSAIEHIYSQITALKKQGPSLNDTEIFKQL